MGRTWWCDKAMVRRATGGMLTVLAESGSGTLAGSAHMEAFRQLAANDAASVAECINRQYTRRVLNAAFPGQPALVRFELIPPVTDDRAAQAQILATLASAGFKPAADVVSEMMGFDVAAVEQPQQDVGRGMLHVGFNASAAAPHVVANSQAENAASVSEPSSQILHPTSNIQNPTSNIQNPTSNIQNPPRSAPLSESELAALQSLASGGLSADALQGTSQALADALQGAIANSEACRAKDPAKCRFHGDAQKNDGAWEPMSKEESDAEDFAAEWAGKRADIADKIRQTEAGKTIQATLDSLKERKEGEAPSAEHHLLNEVDSATIAKVKELCGRDVSGYRHSVSAAGLSHAKNGHPYLSDDDFMLIPDITSNWDSIKYEHSKYKGDRLKYSKTYGDTTYEVVERIGRSNTRTSQKKLHFITEYITKHPADEK